MGMRSRSLDESFYLDEQFAATEVPLKIEDVLCGREELMEFTGNAIHLPHISDIHSV